MRTYAFLCTSFVALALVSCDSSQTEADGTGDIANSVQQVELEDGAEEAPSQEDGNVLAGVDETGVTPMPDRVATIGLLNKRNNVSKDLEISPGSSVEEGPVILTLAACERTAPYEFPQETGAFVQVDVLERGEESHSRVFSGWLFKENPSLNVVEHPVYDVWVKDCAMSFPGE